MRAGSSNPGNSPPAHWRPGLNKTLAPRFQEVLALTANGTDSESTARPVEALMQDASWQSSLFAYRWLPPGRGSCAGRLRAAAGSTPPDLRRLRDQPGLFLATGPVTSGLFVLTTLRNPDLEGVASLLRNWDFPDAQITSALQVAVNQRLVRRLCSLCSEVDVTDDDQREWLQVLGLAVPNHLRRSGGCADCQQTGYRGRIGLFEVGQINEAHYDLILQHAGERSPRRRMREAELKSVLEDGLIQAGRGITSLRQLQQMGGHHG